MKHAVYSFLYHNPKVMIRNYSLCWYQQCFPYNLSVTTYKQSSEYFHVFTLNFASLFRLEKYTNNRKFWLIIRTSRMLIKQKIIKYLLQYYNKLIVARNINSASVELFIFKLSPTLHSQQTVFTKVNTRVYAQLPTLLRTLLTSVSLCCIYS